MESCGSLAAAVLVLLLIDVAQSSLKDQAKEAMKNCRLSLQLPCPDPDNVKFHLYTRQNPKKSQLVSVSHGRDNLHKTFFNPLLPNKVVIHGLSPHQYQAELVAIKDAYLAREEVNVWMVNWAHYAAGGYCVMFSMRNTDHVARCSAQLINAISRHTKSSIHVIADRAGVRVAHKLVYAVSPLTLDRITGLNPEGGLLPSQNDMQRLSPDDADFVDTIHTLPFLPNTDLFGQVDFYVNPNRLHQPGCEQKDRAKFQCDQARALQYFAESITSKVGFLAWECLTYAKFVLGACNPHPPSVIMGDSCPLNTTGTYIVYTTTESPYALGSWESSRYQEKGPKMRTDAISRYSTILTRKIEEIEGKTPEIVKEMGLIDQLKQEVDSKSDDLKDAALRIGLRGVKAVATHIIEKKLKANNNQSQGASDVEVSVEE